MASILFALLLNVLVAAFRLKIIASDVGSPLNFRQALAAVSGGSLAGAAFFQIAGQLMARGVIMARSGIPFASVVVMTTYERIIAALLSGLLALVGAYVIFGHVVIDRYAGGDQLIKIIGGLLVATIAGTIVGHGKLTRRAIAPFMNWRVAARILRIVGLSLLVQSPMMVAYVVAAHALSPQTSVVNITAASAIVMFAASVPISLAGWGVREMSAVVALGTIGVGTANALVAAIIIGAGSMFAMALMAALSLRSSSRNANRAHTSAREPIDYARVLAWVLPLAAATFVLFQIYIPMPSKTLLNANLADPIVILAGALFVLRAVRARALPRWRFSPLNSAVAAATLSLSASLLIGATEIGWTEWAVVNRYLGWFVLLAYAVTGSLIVREGETDALRTLLLTFSGATAAIAAMEICLSILRTGGLVLPVTPNSIEGFALNHNFFAFELLMALAATFVAARAPALRMTLIAILIAGLWFTGSRSGWITLPFVFAAAIYLQASRIREIATATICAAGLALIPVVQGIFTGASRLPALIPSQRDTAERILSITSGLRMFADHPVFGAGLGAFRNQLILRFSDQPLLIHSTAVWMLAELGIIGFLIFTIPVLQLFYTEIRLKRRDVASKLIVLSLVVFGAMSTPADMLYQRTFWLLIGAALALPKSNQASPDTGPNA
jgi:O-antigen ligase